MSSLVNNTTVNVAINGSRLTTASASSSSIVSSLLSWLSIAYYPMTAYYLPFTLLFGILNNVVVLAVMLGRRGFRERTSKTARLYYIAISAADVGCVLAIPLPWFLGMQPTSTV